jgi:hypothetical protein
MNTARISLPLLLVGGLLAACAPDTTMLPPVERDAFAREIDPIVEETLTGLSNDDYEQHARYFDDEMRDRVDPIVTFPQVYDEIIGTVGSYQSHQLVSVEEQNLYRIATYEVAFANDPHVTAQFIFWESDTAHQITGLWFDSDLLRGN